MNSKILIIVTSLCMLLSACGNRISSSENVQSEVQTTTVAETMTYQQITQEEAKEMMKADNGHIIVDVRRQDEYDSGHIPDAILIPNESIGTEKPSDMMILCNPMRGSISCSWNLVWV